MLSSIIPLLWTTVLPSLIKLALYIIDKKVDNKAFQNKKADNQILKEEFLKFISEMQKDLPIKLHEKYSIQIEGLKERMRQDQVGVKSLLDAHNNWRDGYESLLKEHEEVLKELEAFKNGKA